MRGHRRHPDRPPGATIGYIGLPQGMQLDGQMLFFSQTGMQGGPVPVCCFLPHLMEQVLRHKIDPGEGPDLTLSLAEVAEGCRAMGEGRAIKTLLRVSRSDAGGTRSWSRRRTPFGQW